jgi:hypothetical protein
MSGDPSPIRVLTVDDAEAIRRRDVESDPRETSRTNGSTSHRKQAGMSHASPIASISMETPPSSSRKRVIAARRRIALEPYRAASRFLG